VRVVRSKLDRKEDLEMLNWLTLQSIDYGPQHSDFLKRREPGTCQWLLDSVEYQDWLKGDKQTLFCPGIPGAGKTILTSVVVHDLTVRFSKNQGVGIAYIYCNFQRQGEQNVDNLLLNLLKQLAESHSSLPESVKSLYNDHKTKRTRPSLDEASTVLQSVAAVYSRIFLIVDALDECQASDGCRARFLSELSNFQSRYRANIFATSRFIPDIIDHFKPSIPLEVRASQKDVARYLEGHMGQLPSIVHQNQELQEEIIKGISEAVDGMYVLSCCSKKRSIALTTCRFLLAQIYLGLLDDKLTLNDIRSALEVFRKQGQGLDEDQKVRVLAQAYEQAMERIKGQKLGLKNLAMKVLSWITCANRPLTTLELQHALATKAGKSELDQGDLPHIEDMVSVCSGLVTVDEESNIIRLVHYTTQEYFKRTQQDWFPNSEAEITKICVTYLSFGVFDSGFCLTDDEFEERLQLNKLYNYAAQNWGHHARKALASCVEVVHFLNHKAEVEGSSQALLAIKRYRSHSGYSQEFPNQITGLHLAAYFGVEEAAKAVLQERVGAEGKDTYGRTPLSWAAENGHEAVVKLLLEKGAELESKDRYGRTPLSWAAMNGHKAVIKLLLKKGAELECKDSSYGQTPLLLAAGNGHKAAIKLLLKKGAELESKDRYGRTPLSLAAGNGHEAVVKLLLEKGAELGIRDRYGRTPLSWAAENGHEAVVKLLLEKGAELESKDIDGQTPLLLAAGNGHEAVVKLLLEKGAELESKDIDGQTPLSCAAEYGHEAVVKLLLEKGATIKGTLV
jgi:ankyrin repeat protein